ncbi:hypothetical protein [Brevundimonas sp.]|uniref:hypothetical protein n=1 Tax=Brevundimonas sp. TaxID=1871086 RepID=UPI0035AEB258
MRTEGGVFTPRERKAALWALIGAALIAAGGIVVQQHTSPSLGGMDAYVSAPPPGVLEAQPLQG